MTKFKSICVYLGASNDADPQFQAAAAALGKRIANEQKTLVYGGGSMGTMGILANAALEADGFVTGVIPKSLADLEGANEALTELHIVNSLHERKMMMAEKSDAFMVLPGGYGTLEEFFEIFTWRKLQLHDKPIIVLNIEGYWDPLEALFEHIIAHKFDHYQEKALCHFVTSIDEAFAVLETLPEARMVAKLKQT